MTFRKNAEQLPAGLTYDELPTWMRKTHREIDWALLVVGVLCLIVVWPLIDRPGLPRNNGAQVELSRTIEMGISLESGTLYPRWASDFNFSYGSPLWNYLAPLPHYLSGLHYVLAQANPETSVRVIMGLGLALAGIGMFGFVRQRWGTYAGVLAAVVYLYSPQLVLVKPYLMTDLAGLLAAGLFPMILWSLNRVLKTRYGWDIALAASLIALLWLTGTPLNMVLFAVVVGWLVWRYLWDRRGGYAWLSVGAGTGMSAFYWLPAWAERSAAHWHPALDSPLEAARRLSPKAMLSLVSPLDLHAINPVQTDAIGAAGCGLALVAGIATFIWLWQRTPAAPEGLARGDAFQWRLVRLLKTVPVPTREALYFLLVGVGIFALVTPLGTRFWQALPTWPPLYPRDLLPLLAACCAVLAAQLGYLLEHHARSTTSAVGMSTCVGLVLVSALPTLYPPPWTSSYPTPDLTTVLHDEVRGYMIASQQTGWLLPSDSATMPEPSPLLVASYEAASVDKVARDKLPPSTKVDVVRHEPQSEHMVVETAQPVTLTLLTFYYAGWQARVDGEPVFIRPEPVTGFITFEVPAGRHEVVVYFGSTAARNVGWLLSGLALLVALVVSGLVESRLATIQNIPRFQTHMPLVRQVVLLTTVLLCGATSLIPRFFPEAVTIRSSRGIVEPAQEVFPRALLGGIDLLAYDLDGRRIKSGDDVVITLYWRAARPDLPDYQANLMLVDEANQQIALIRHRHPALIPSSQWPTWPLLDYYVRDAYYISPDTHLRPGIYRVEIQVGACSEVNLMPCDSLEPLFVTDGRGTSLGQRIVLPASIEVKP